jgi:hypothetical protein
LPIFSEKNNVIFFPKINVSVTVSAKLPFLSQKRQFFSPNLSAKFFWAHVQQQHIRGRANFISLLGCPPHFHLVCQNLRLLHRLHSRLPLA